jgi:hypothetical protein
LTAARSRDGAGTRQLLLRIAFTVVLLVPLALLFVDARASVTERDTNTRQERIGVEYLRALEPLTKALIEAQSAAVVGQPGKFAAVTAQVDKFQDIDTRYGAQLGLTRRWAALRDRIAQLPSVTGPAAAYGLFSEATSVALALYLEVWRDAYFDVDPDRDSASLQSAVTIDLPRIAVAAGRYNDAVVLNRGKEMTATTLAELISLRDEIVGSGRTLIANLQDAVDVTKNAGLSNLLFDELSAMQQRVDAVAAARGLVEGSVTVADVTTAGLLGESMGRTVSAMYAKALAGLDTLLGARQSELQSDLLRLNLAGGAGLLLALCPLGFGVWVWIRTRREPGAPDDLDEPEDTGAIAGFPVWSSSVETAETGSRRERSVVAR